MSRCVPLVSSGFSLFPSLPFFWWGVKGTCREHVRVPHTCRPRAPVPSREAERGDPGEARSNVRPR